MQVEKNKVVEIDYTLKDDDGQLLDSSEGGDPLSYIQGVGNLIPGVESALEGKSAGERVQIIVPPESGYGVRDDSLVLSIERDKLSEVGDLQEGARLRMETQKGPVILTVVSVGDSEVLVDGNHPLAGMSLNFDITIQSVREATSEELDHGHVHG
jgi:FKBP-type peptidyl-prolyl cis-trans isomerase SlyD